VDKWKQVTSDPWVLKIVKEGLRLKFVSKPPKSGVRTTNLLNIVHMSNILEEVKKLLGKGAIELVPPGQLLSALRTLEVCLQILDATLPLLFSTPRDRKLPASIC
jgi:uncharacterized protein